jgi:hypothetical protein
MRRDGSLHPPGERMTDGITAGHSIRTALAPRNLGLVGKVAESWGVAGGLLGAGVVSVHMLTGHLSSSLGFLTATLFFVAGSLIGFLHGGILGYLGRPPEVARALALRRLGLAAVYAVPAMVVGWLFAMALALSAIGLAARRPEVIVFSAVGWLGLGGAAIWAATETRRAIPHLCRRWPGARAALAILTLAFLALVPFFLISRPDIWVLGVRPTETAAVIMAATATLWIGGPLVAIGVLAARAWRRQHRSPQRG